MDDILDWGISVITCIQKIESPFLTAFISFITNCGDVYFFLPVLLAFLWCINEKKAFRLTCVLLLSVNINNIIKYALCIPRPFFRDPSVKIGFDPTYSTPSGHSQQSVAFWGTAGILAKNSSSKIRRALWIVAFAMPVVIGFTRMYLGLHYPTDILLGWAIGAVVVVVAWLTIPLVERYVVPLQSKAQILIATVITYLGNMFCPEDSGMPGLFFGFTCGYILLRNHGGFSAAAGTRMQKILRFVVGLVIIAIVYTAFLLIPANVAESQRRFVRFAKYACTGLAISFVAPKIFIQLNLAESAQQETAENSNE